MTVEELKKRIKEVAVGHYLANEDGMVEIYTDYNDRLSHELIDEVLEADHPQETFDEKIWDMESDLAYDSGYGVAGQFEADVKKYLSNEEMECWENNEDEINDFIQENFYYAFDRDSKFMNPDVCMYIMVDTGDANYDWSCNDLYGANSFNGEYPVMDESELECSGVRWLAGQQGHLEELDAVLKEVRAACEEKREFNLTGDMIKGKFMKSLDAELSEAAGSDLQALTFAVKMPLQKAIEIKEEITAEDELNRNIDARMRQGNGSITLDKGVACGLFNDWAGCGSQLEIELEKAVELPIKYIGKFECDYSHKRLGIFDTYGMDESFYKEGLKEIKAHDPEQMAREEAEAEKNMEPIKTELLKEVVQEEVESWGKMSDRMTDLAVNWVEFAQKSDQKKSKTGLDVLAEEAKKCFVKRHLTSPSKKNYKEFVVSLENRYGGRTKWAKANTNNAKWKNIEDLMNEKKSVASVIKKIEKENGIGGR